MFVFHLANFWIFWVKRKKYDFENREKAYKRSAVKVQCDRCNMVVRTDYLTRHMKTKSCINALPRGLINLLDEDDENAITSIMS